MKPQTRPQYPSVLTTKKVSLYGLLAQFKEPEELMTAILRTRGKGFENIQAYTPFPVEGLSEALGIKDNRVALFTLLGGILGGSLGFFMQWYSMAIAYPLNVGGRPLNSWPAFVPVTFELTILFAALSAIFSMFALNGLPQPYHPVFNVPEFERASNDGFFLCIKAQDPVFKLESTRRFLESLSPRGVYEVPYEP